MSQKGLPYKLYCGYRLLFLLRIIIYKMLEENIPDKNLNDIHENWKAQRTKTLMFSLTSIELSNMEKIMIKPTNLNFFLIWSNWWVLDREQCSEMKKKSQILKCVFYIKKNVKTNYWSNAVCFISTKKSIHRKISSCTSTKNAIVTSWQKSLIHSLTCLPPFRLIFLLWK